MDAKHRALSERGQGTVEWIAIVGLVSLVFVALVAAGVRVPGVALAESLATRLACVATFSGTCGGGDADGLVAAYGEEMATLVRDHAPALLYEDGMHALPVDYRACRSTACGDGTGDGTVRRSETGEPVTLFTHVIDCRPGEADATEAEGADCSGDRAGRLYVEFWEYYADSATLRGVPIAGEKGYHADDWEGTTFRINPDGSVDQRASSHNGYNYEQGVTNWGSDADIGPLKGAAEVAGLRPHGGWGPSSGGLYISGGSHAGNVRGNLLDIGSTTPSKNIRLVPLEPIATAGDDTKFAITPPWVKDIWTDPEAEGTG